MISRLARREFVDISTEMSFRFRDVYDHLVRVADDALMFQDRITGMLDAHLSNVSFRLNEVMKVLTIVATIFMPPTLLVGLWGVNVPLPRFPGGDPAQFWWLAGLTVVEVGYSTVLPHEHKVLLIVGLVGFAAVKASMVALYLMHLRFERVNLVLTIVPAVVIAICLLLVFFPDSFRARNLRYSAPPAAAPSEAPK